MQKINGGKLERDADFTVQNYAEDKLASGEVILGYFHYARVLDIVGDGKTLFITNKRIYTTKEKFTEFNAISQCEPVKKLMLTYIVFHKTDGTVIPASGQQGIDDSGSGHDQPPDCCVKGHGICCGLSYCKQFPEYRSRKTMIFDTANSMKKGLGALFERSLKSKITLVCTCMIN